MMSWVRSRFFAMAASFALVALSVAPAAGEVAYIIKSPSGDRDVSIIFSHDPDAESEILAKIGERGHILLWQIQCSDKYVFYRPFEFTQGRMSVRPVLCLVKKFFCETDGERKGYVYQGYLFLEPNFDLKSPIKVTLADKHLRATFIQ